MRASYIVVDGCLLWPVGIGRWGYLLDQHLSYCTRSRSMIATREERPRFRHQPTGIQDVDDKKTDYDAAAPLLMLV